LAEDSPAPPERGDPAESAVGTDSVSIRRQSDPDEAPAEAPDSPSEPAEALASVGGRAGRSTPAAPDELPPMIPVADLDLGPEPVDEAPPPAAPPSPKTPPAWVTWLSVPQNSVIAIVATIAVIAILGVVVVTGNQKPPSQSVVAGGAPPDSAGASAALQNEVDSLSRYVESARGLKFLQPVKAQLLSDAAFDARLQALGTGRLDIGQLAGHIATAEALGLLPTNFDATKTPDPTTAGVLGFYDPATKVLAVRGDYASVYVRKTLVHELTHALQDQHFGIGPLLSASSDDAALARRSLVEGDAHRIEENWVSTLSIQEQDLLERQARQAGDEEFPTAFDVGFDNFPYVVGSMFTQSLLDKGGQSALDGAFSRPPQSTKQIIDPSRYLAGDNPIAVSAPPADGQVIDQGTLGEFELIYVLGEVIPSNEAVVLASDWGGSRFVTWRGATGPCVRARFVTESLGGAQAMQAALQAWASSAPGRSATGINPITLTACAS
jgi:hypothetical protein